MGQLGIELLAQLQAEIVMGGGIFTKIWKVILSHEIWS